MAQVESAVHMQECSVHSHMNRGNCEYLGLNWLMAYIGWK